MFHSPSCYHLGRMCGKNLENAGFVQGSIEALVNRILLHFNWVKHLDNITDLTV
jgi:hypothetical protein